MAESRTAGEVRVKLIPELADDSDFRHTLHPTHGLPGGSGMDTAATRLEQAAASIQAAFAGHSRAGASLQSAAAGVNVFGANARPDVYRAAELLASNEPNPLSVLQRELSLSDSQARRSMRQASKPLIDLAEHGHMTNFGSNTMAHNAGELKIKVTPDLQGFREQLRSELSRVGAESEQSQRQLGSSMGSTPAMFAPRSMEPLQLQSQVAVPIERLVKALDGVATQLRSSSATTAQGGQSVLGIPAGLPTLPAPTAFTNRLDAMFGDPAASQQARMVAEFARTEKQAQVRRQLSAGERYDIGQRAIAQAFGERAGLRTEPAARPLGFTGTVDIGGDDERPRPRSARQRTFFGGEMPGLTAYGYDFDRPRDDPYPRNGDRPQRTLSAPGGVPPFVDAEFTASDGGDGRRRGGSSAMTPLNIDLGGGGGGGMLPPDRRGGGSSSAPRGGGSSGGAASSGGGLFRTPIIPTNTFFAGFFGTVEAAGAAVRQSDEYARGSAFASNSLERLDSDLAAVDAVSGGFMGAVSDLVSRPYQNVVGIDRAGTERLRADALRIEERAALVRAREDNRFALQQRADLLRSQGFGRDRTAIDQDFKQQVRDARRQRDEFRAKDTQAVDSLEGVLEESREDRVQKRLATLPRRMYFNGDNYLVDGEDLDAFEATKKVRGMLEAEDAATVAAGQSRRSKERDQQFNLDIAAAAEVRDAGLADLYRTVNTASSNRLRGAMSLNDDVFAQLDEQQRQERQAMRDATEGLPMSERLFARGSLGAEHFAQQNAAVSPLRDATNDFRNRAAVLQGQLNRDPFGAQRLQLANERDGVLDSLPEAVPGTGIIGMAIAGTRRAVTDYYELGDQAITQQRDDTLANLRSQTGIGDALLGRDRREADRRGLALDRQMALQGVAGDAGLATETNRFYDVQDRLLEQSFRDADQRFDFSIGMTEDRLDARLGGRGIEAELRGRIDPLREQAMQLRQQGRNDEADRVFGLIDREIGLAERDANRVTAVQVRGFNDLTSPGANNRGTFANAEQAVRADLVRDQRQAFVNGLADRFGLPMGEVPSLTDEVLGKVQSFGSGLANAFTSALGIGNGGQAAGGASTPAVEGQQGNADVVQVLQRIDEKMERVLQAIGTI